MKILVFDIWSDYAHFRKPYTTTSPLTFPFPPRTAIAGIIGSIIGKKKDDITCQNDDSFIAVQISANNPIKKIRVGENLTQVTKKIAIVDLQKASNKLNQIRYEFLKEPRYTIYFSHKDLELYNGLKDHLINHTSVYTPYLGISELIANFEFEGEYDLVEKQANGFVELDCVVPKKLVLEDSIQFGDNSEYFNTRMPNKMDSERVVKEYIEILFERNGKSITAKPIKYWHIEGKNGRSRNIIFL